MDTNQTNGVLVLNTQFNKRKPRKLTQKLIRLMFESLINEYNITLACSKVGITGPQFYKYYNDNDKFKQQIDIIKEYHLDKCESAMFVVGSETSRQGFQDRKLALQSYRRSTYGDKLNVDSKHLVKIDINMPELNQLLDHNGAKSIKPMAKALPAAEDIEYKEVK